MRPYGKAIAVYANRPLLRWSMAIVVALAIYTIAYRHNPDFGYRLAGMIFMIGIMGVQVAGYIGVTAIQLIWNDRARVTPGVKAAHGPVIVGILLGLLAFVAVVAKLSMGNTFEVVTVMAEITAIGLWIVTTRKWWMVPALLYFLSLATLPGSGPYTPVLFAISILGIAAWVWKLLALGGEPIDFTADFFIRADFPMIWALRHIMELGPVWVLSRIHWRRGSMMWRLARWWPASGDGWMVLLLYIPAYAVAFAHKQWLDDLLSKSEWPFSVPAATAAGLTMIPLVMSLSMVLSRGHYIALQAILPVRRRTMLVENLAIIAAEVSATWALAMIPLAILSCRGVAVFDPQTTAMCIGASGALTALVLGLLVWFERRPMEIRGMLILIATYVIAAMSGRWIKSAPNPLVLGCVLMTFVAAVVVWVDAVRRWASADLTRTPGEGRILHV
jgi:hypothetical protein